MKRIRVELTFDEYRALGDKAEELANAYARIVADEEGRADEKRYRKSYRLWAGIQNAVVSDSEWIDD